MYLSRQKIDIAKPTNQWTTNICHGLPSRQKKTRELNKVASGKENVINQLIAQNGIKGRSMQTLQAQPVTLVSHIGGKK